MDKASSKRMIGAIVLVLVAALVLAWLLKDKNRQRDHNVENKKLPSQSILNFPSTNPPVSPDAENSANTTVTNAEKPEKSLIDKATLGDTVTFDVKPRGRIREKVDTDTATTKNEDVPKKESQPRIVQPRLVNERKATPPKEEKKTVVKKTVARKTGKYAVQLLSTPKKSKANALRDTMLAEGHDAFIIKFQHEGKTYYRVRIGAYLDMEAAKKVHTILKARYTKNKYVQESVIMK